jgi:copper transport protein
MIKKSLWLLGLLVVLFGIVPDAMAHGYIVRAIPEDRAVFDRPPTRLQYWFSEALEIEFSELNVRDQSGEIIATGGVAENDDTLMTVRLPNSLDDGAYIVELRPAFASDGHVVAESRVFFVGEEIGGVAGQSATNQAVPLEVAWKAVFLASSTLLFGLFTLYALVLVPAWGNARYAAGLLPPRVMRRLNVITGYTLAVTFGSLLVALVQQTMVFFNIDFTQALNPDFWSLVRIGSRFGDVWNWRMLLLGVVGASYLASLYYTDKQPASVRAFWTANAWVMALVLGSSSVLSHAAGSLILPWVGVAVDWLHIIAVGFWVGGLAALVLVLPRALDPYTGEQRRMALLAALRRFSRIAAGAVVVVIATGVYSSTNWIFGMNEVQSSFGASLGFKLVLVGLLVGLGALHHIALRPAQYARFRALTGRIGNFSRTLRLEAVAALLVVGAAGLLTATPVPVPEFAQEEIAAPTQVIERDGLMVVMTLSPGGPGINTHDTTITRDGERVEGLDMVIRNMRPARSVRSDLHQLETIEAGLYITVTDDFDNAGNWWTLLDLTTPDGEQERLAFEWGISDEAAVIESIQPSVVNIAALLAVVAAVIYAIFPLLRGFYNALDLSPISVAIAFSATAATVVMLWGGFVLVQNSREDYQDTLQPVPQHINAVLPSQYSLDRGQALYEQHCAAWTESNDLNALVIRLPRTSDEELYLMLRDGWRDLPACAGDLSLYEHWHVVNYIRTFEQTAAATVQNND